MNQNWNANYLQIITNGDSTLWGHCALLFKEKEKIATLQSRWGTIHTFIVYPSILIKNQNYLMFLFQ
jgi:hypothetical protein